MAFNINLKKMHTWRELYAGQRAASVSVTAGLTVLMELYLSDNLSRNYSDLDLIFAQELFQLTWLWCVLHHELALERSLLSDRFTLYLHGFRKP